MKGSNNSPLVSIILPVYNAHQYLTKCLDSLIGQSYKNIEILCYNDGSTDDSIEILNRYAQSDNRIIVIDEQNRGVSVVRNCGIEQAKGNYLMFSDADDWWELNAVERALDTIVRYEADVVLFSYFREYQNKTLKKSHIFADDLEIFEGERAKDLWRSFAGLVGEELRYPENMDSLNALWSKIYKRDVFLQHDEVRYVNNRKIGAGGDGLLNFMYFKYVKKAVYISDCLYHYRKTNENSIVSKYKPDFVKKRFYLFELYSKYINDNNLDNSFKIGLSNRIALSIIGLGLHEISSDNTQRFKYNSIKEILNDTVYQNGLRQLNTEYMPIHWQLFFNACRRKDAFVVYALLVAIKYAKKLV